MKCNKCLKDYDEKYIHCHHVFPKHAGGNDLDKRVYLCKKCHEEYHILEKIINPKTKEEYYSHFINFMQLDSSNNPLCSKCANRMGVFKVKARSIIFNCAVCGNQQEGNLSHFSKFIQEKLKEDEDDSI